MATPANSQAELLSLANNWASFSGSVRKKYSVQIFFEHEEDDKQNEEECNVVNKNCKSCKNCPACVYFYLQHSNVLGDVEVSPSTVSDSSCS